jgi:thiamine pyrophosphate-dependent acetolactate synthase large subunit-like protein
MQKLSESLETLSVRAKNLEDSATATFEADRAKLEQRGREIDTALTADRNKFESKVHEAADAGRSWWDETTDALARPIRELRARHEARKSEHEIHKALRTADAAEEDAVVAIDIATYWLNVAEYAVIDATLARLSADDLAMAAGENEPVQVAGGVS